MGLGTFVGHPETDRFKEPCQKVGNPESVARTAGLPHEKTHEVQQQRMLDFGSGNPGGVAS